MTRSQYLLTWKNGIYISLNADGTSGIQIFEISNKLKLSPKKIGSKSTFNAVDIFVKNEFLYLADSEHGLKIFDVSDPSKISLVGTLPEKTTLVRSLQNVDIIITGEEEFGFRIIDVSVKSNPVPLGGINGSNTSTVHDILVSEDQMLMYLAVSDGEMHTVDISNFSEPEILSTASLGSVDSVLSVGIFTSFSSGDKFAYLASQNYQLQIVNITDFWFPSLITPFRDSGEKGSIKKSIFGTHFKKYLYSLQWNSDEEGQMYEGRILILDVEKDSNFSVLGYIPVSDPYDFVVDEIEEYLYVSDGSVGFKVIDIKNKENPRIISDISTKDDADCILYFTSSGFEYVIIGLNGDDDIIGFQIFNVTNKTNPILVTERGDQVGIDSISISSDKKFLYLAGYGGIYIYEISDLSNPKFLSSSHPAFKINEIYLQESENEKYLFIADDTDGLLILDVKDPENPVIKGSFNTHKAVSLKVSKNVVFLSDRTAGLQILDISDVSKPKLVSSFIEFEVFGVEVFENQIFLSCGEFGLVLLTTDLTVVPKPDFSYFCGELKFQILATDETGTIVSEVSVRRENYCHKRGECERNYRCNCSFGYEGDSCMSWKCGGIDANSLSDFPCTGNGRCILPEVCDCEPGYGGKECQVNVLFYATFVPILSSTFISVVYVAIVVFILLICCGICCCCCLVGVFGCCICVFCLAVFFFCCLSCILCVLTCGYRFRVKRFGRLRNFNILLKEQEMDDDETIAHIRIDKSLFEIPMSEIKMESILGSGGSDSTVYLAKWKGQKVAFKVFKTRSICNDQNSFDEFEREVSVLGSISHPHIIRYFGSSLESPRIGIVMEYCENGDLENFVKRYKLKNKKRYPYTEKLRMIWETCHAMEYLHSRKILHRDLKLENVLVDGSESCRLMDFGLSRIVEEMSVAKTTRIGTNVYMSPEIVKTGKYDEKTDVFSMSIFIFILLTENMLPYGKNCVGVELQVAQDPEFRPRLEELRKSFSGGEEEWVCEVVKKCWSHRPSERMTMKEICEVVEQKREKIDVQMKDDDDETKEDELNVEKVRESKNSFSGEEMMNVLKKENQELKDSGRRQMEEIERLKKLMEESQVADS